MKLTQLIEDDDAVSPVIGVILMVAITVILAAVIGTFVLGLGDQVSNTAPSASFSFDYDDSKKQLDITHDGGDTITASQASIVVSGTQSATKTWNEVTSNDVTDITAGDNALLGDNSGGSDISSVEPGDTVRVTWQASGGGKTSTLGKWTGPEAN